MTNVTNAQILDGKAASKQLRQRVSERIAQRTKQGFRPPALAVIIVGEDPASSVYVNAKRKACATVGVRSLAYDLPEDTLEDALLALVAKLAADTSVDGILVQLPLPAHMNSDAVLDRIPAHKDVDGFHPDNMGRLVQRRPQIRACTPYGIMQLLDYAGLNDLTGMHAVIVGASNHVGRPMALELLLARCTVTVCHRFTTDLAQHVRAADLLIIAAGKRGVVESQWIKLGAIVVDVGIHRLDDGHIVGDIEFDSAKQRAGWISPVPGGVGPMTIATLLLNTLFANEMNQGVALDNTTIS